MRTVLPVPPLLELVGAAALQPAAEEPRKMLGAAEGPMSSRAGGAERLPGEAGAAAAQVCWWAKRKDRSLLHSAGSRLIIPPHGQGTRCVHRRTGKST